jgi:hypothetical protein
MGSGEIVDEVGRNAEASQQLGERGQVVQSRDEAAWQGAGGRPRGHLA